MGKTSIRCTLVTVAVAAASLLCAAPPVSTLRLPDQGVQPQVASGPDGSVHLVFLAGDAKAADVFYSRVAADGTSLWQPIRVNSQPGSATAAGTIRGAQIAIGRKGMVHVAWNGSSAAQPKGPLNPAMPADSPFNGLPMLYSRLASDGKFEPQRNLMQHTYGLDGGGSIAADGEGNVYAAWHASTAGTSEGEGGRQVWVARSSDGGATFARENAPFSEPVGACGCCGMRLFASGEAGLLALYRSATETIHRDTYLLRSVDQGASFRGQRVSAWEIGACPMSSMYFSEGPTGLLAAWETAEQVYFGAVNLDSLGVGTPLSPPGAPDHRKHPVLAQSGDYTLLTWVEAKGWGKPPALHWQTFGPGQRPVGAPGGVDAIPAWSFAGAFVRPDGGFVIVY